ncbi:MAG: FixH family protein [Bacteroidia bacterium]
MTINWGYKILILYTAFIAGILFLVYKCSQQDVDLVSENYYERELKFQDQINRTNNVAMTGNTIKAEIKESEKQLLLTFPSSVSGKKISGEIHMFRPDNSKLDLKIPVDITAGLQYIDISKMAKGFWRMQVSWQINEMPLYQEEKIFIK